MTIPHGEARRGRGGWREMVHPLRKGAPYGTRGDETRKPRASPSQGARVLTPLPPLGLGAPVQSRRYRGTAFVDGSMRPSSDHDASRVGTRQSQASRAPHQQERSLRYLQHEKEAQQQVHSLPRLDEIALLQCGAYQETVGVGETLVTGSGQHHAGRGRRWSASR